MPHNAMPPSRTSSPRPVVLVLGVQRSGTNVLHRSLALDPWVSGFNEDKDNEFFQDYRLRPKAEIKPWLDAVSNTILLKPIMEVIDGGVEEVEARFAGREVLIAWIYRDPVNVFHSRVKHWPNAPWTEPESFAAKWSEINRKGLAALERAPERTAVVRYEDLSLDYGTFRDASRFLGIQGVWLFRADSRGGYRHVSEGDRETVLNGTRQVLEELDAARSFKPAPMDSLTGEAAELAVKLRALRAQVDERRGQLAELEQEARDLEYRLFNAARAASGRD